MRIKFIRSVVFIILLLGLLSACGYTGNAKHRSSSQNSGPIEDVLELTSGSEVVQFLQDESGVANANVESAMDIVTIVPTVTDDVAEVSVNGATPESANKSIDLQLDYGLNTFTVTTFNADGLETGHYDIAIVRGQYDASLQTQEITFETVIPLTATFGSDVTPNLVTGGLGGGSVTYYSNNESIATVDPVSGQVTVVGIGTVSISAVKAEDATYNSAYASYEIVVERGVQTISFTNPGPINKLFSDSSFSNSASGGAGTGSITYSSSNPAIATVDPSTGNVSILDVGSVTITAVKAEDGLYNSASNSYILNINPADQNAGFTLSGPIDKVATDANFLNAAVYQGTGAVQYSSSDETVATVNGATGEVDLLTAGSTIITATIQADTQYQGATISYGINVSTAAQAASFDSAGPINKIATDADFNNALSKLGSGQVTYSSSDPTVATVDAVSGIVSPLTAGSTVITARIATDNVYAGDMLNYTVDVSLSPHAIAFDQTGPLYTHTDSTVANVVGASASASAGGVTYSSDTPGVATVDANTGAVNIVAAGTAVISATQASDGVYQSANTDYTINVVQNKQDITMWVGATDTNIDLPPTAAGLTIYSSTDLSCDTANYSLCANGSMNNVVIPTTIDSNVTVSQAAGNWYEFGSGANAITSKPVYVGASRFGDRWGVAVTEFNGKLWLVGGYEGGYKNDVWSSEDGFNWKQETAAAPFAGRADHQLVAFNGKMWLLAGSGGTDYNDVWSSSDGVTWTQEVAAAPFVARWGHVSTVFQNKIWIIAGYGASELNDVWSSVDGINWVEEVNSAPFPGRSDSSLIALNGKMFLIAGSGNSSLLNDIWTTTDGVTWVQETASAAFPARWGHSVAYYNNALFITGGSDNTNDLGDLWTSTDGVNWTFVKDLPAVMQRYDVVLIPFDGKLWNIPGSGNASVGIWYTSDGLNWLGIDGNSGYRTRLQHNVVNFNGKLWLYNGRDYLDLQPNDILSSDDGIYWQLESDNMGFTPKDGAQVVEFNNKLWMIGGYENGSTYLPLGEILSSTDGTNWTLETSAPAFTRRTEHRSVVFNNKIWLIGGFNSTQRNDVWSSTDGVTWIEETTNANFSARIAPAVTVFNGKMWLYGGWEDGTWVYLNDIWSSTDGINWTQETANAAFTPRRGHTVTEYNGKLYMVGGRGPGLYPDSDVWSSTDGVSWVQETAAAPFAGRYEHTAVVFNGKLLITGGGASDGSNNDYNDTWVTTDGVTWRTGHSKQIGFR